MNALKAIKSGKGCFLTLKEAKELVVGQTELLLQYVDCMAGCARQKERDEWRDRIEGQIGKVISSWEMVGQLTDPSTYLTETFGRFKDTVEIVEVPDDFEPNVDDPE